MPKLETTLLETIELSMDSISHKIESYRDKLAKSTSYFETDKHVEALMDSKMLFKERSDKLNKYLDDLIKEYYLK